MSIVSELKQKYPEIEYLDGWVYETEGDDYPLEIDGEVVLIDNLVEIHYAEDFKQNEEYGDIFRWIIDFHGSYKNAFNSI